MWIISSYKKHWSISIHPDKNIKIMNKGAKYLYSLENLAVKTIPMKH